MGNLPSLSYGSVYMKLWHGLCALDSDPHPGVAGMSQKVTNHIRNQVKESLPTPKEIAEVKLLAASLSLPPSPSNRTSYLNKGESPPNASNLLRSARIPPYPNRVRNPIPNAIAEEADDASGPKNPLTSSQFVDWSCAQFAQPVNFDSETESTSDMESRSHYEREWRYLRNKRLRLEAHEEQNKAHNSRIESQVFHSRCPQQPEVVAFHPFDPHLAVASKDSFGIWDWQSGSKLTYHTPRGSKTGSRITSVEFMNSHDVSLLMTGSDDGSVRVWKSYCNLMGREPTLLTAWQALADVQPASKTSMAAAGLVTSWEQRSMTLAVTGDVRVVRLWDAETELKKQDLPTGADCCATCLDTDGTGYYIILFIFHAFC